MVNNATYIMDDGITIARFLQRLGRWEDALTVLQEGTAEAAAVRAEVLVDRFFWRLDQAKPAQNAVAVLEPEEPALASFLQSQLAYTRLVFDIAAKPDDKKRAREGFAAATADSRLTGWANFWLGVLTEVIDADPQTAGPHYQRALAAAQDSHDVLLESYAVRHQGAQLLETDREAGVRLLRRSYHLRAALGARPQTAAAAVTLADELPAGAEADGLRDAAALAARELQLTWLLRALR
jgi:hypothetical protein